MTNKLNSLLLIGILLIVTSCSNEKETPNGMKYKVLRSGDGVLAKKGEFLVFNYQLKDDKDSIWTDTWNEGIPAYQPISDSSNIPVEDGMRQMLRSLTMGDSVATSMSIGSFFRNLVRMSPPPQLDSTATVTYTIVPVKITTPQGYFEMREPLVASRDSIALENFFERNQLTPETDTLGLRYVLHTKSGGQKPKMGDCVEVKYAGRLLRNGRIFDAADRAAFPVSDGIIQGWQFGLPLIGVGDSATLFVPSRLGYARQGVDGVIPPDAILVFDIKMLAVKSEFDSGTRTCK